MAGAVKGLSRCAAAFFVGLSLFSCDAYNRYLLPRPLANAPEETEPSPEPPTPPVNVARIGSTEYETLSGAFAAVTTDTTIELLRDISLGATIETPAFSATLCPAAGVDCTIQRASGFTGPLFSVTNSLTLEKSTDNHTLTIDGGAVWTGGAPDATGTNKEPTSIEAHAALFEIQGSGSLQLGSGVVLQNNDNTTGNGGAISLAGGACTIKGGGSVINNHAMGDGGAVYCPADSDVSLGWDEDEATTIRGNRANSDGDAIFLGEDVAMEIQRLALINSDNDVYLADGATVSIHGTLSGSGTVLTLTPHDYATAAGTVVLADDDVSTHHTRFNVTPGGGTNWIVDSDGKLAIDNSSVAQIGTTRYNTLLAAFQYAASGSESSPTVITILQDINLTKTEKDSIDGQFRSKYIKLTVPANESHTIKRDAFWSDPAWFFNMQSGRGLTLEGNGTGEIILDGGAVWSGGDGTPAGGATASGVTDERSALVNVTGGKFTMNAGSILQNNNATGNMGGAVYINSTSVFTMNSGTIKNCTAGTGGGVYIKDNSDFIMNGGTIEGNKALGGGGDAYDQGNGVYVDSSGTPTFKMQGAALVNQNNNVFLGDSCVITITRMLSNSPVAKLELATWNSGITQVLFLNSFTTSNNDKFTFATHGGWSIGNDGKVVHN